MTSRTLSFLGLAAVFVLALALWLAYPRSTDQKPTLLYPGLKEELSQVSMIRIFKAGDVPAIELTRSESQWQLAQRSNYPADSAKVRRLLQALADARPTEEKTSNPDNYAALGVEDIADTSATGVRIELSGPRQAVNLIVGKNAGMKGSYVRRAGEATSWLTSESIDASALAHDWLRNSVIDISADRIQSATISIGNDRPYTVAKAARADADFKAEDLPRGKEADTFAANNVATALAGLTLADVRPAQDFAADKPIASATFRTFDGLVVDLDGWSKDGKHYVTARTTQDDALAQRFHVDAKEIATTGDEGSTAAAAKPASDTAGAINARLQGWAYEIADYKYEAIFKPATAVIKK
ncbi:DUF4340 domain-containing protein [Povalibacter sp.]|uniref:DUF4340 domain-containing protein n=1 Tax=Povalibacter sp. TaxID=1962978 RepID=UPI002F3EAED6